MLKVRSCCTEEVCIIRHHLAGQHYLSHCLSTVLVGVLFKAVAPCTVPTDDQHDAAP